VLNSILLIVTVIVVFIALFIRYNMVRKAQVEMYNNVEMTFSRLLDTVKTELTDLVKESSYSGVSELDWSSVYRRQERIRKALKTCVYGIESSKEIVLDLIVNIVKKHLPTEEDIHRIIDFNNEYLEPHTKFEIIIHVLKKTHGKNSMSYMMDKYHLADKKYLIEDGTKSSFLVTIDEIAHVYKDINPKLDYSDKIKILAVLVYQKYKGFGVIDTLLEMNINGVNFGTSGSILESTKSEMSFTQSVWMYFRGTFIHLRFLDFGSEEAMRRVVVLISRYGNPGPLTEKRGYIVNTMADQSRVLALRPSMCECWACFIRKFNLDNRSLESLVIKEYTIRGDVVVKLIAYLMRGDVTTAFTGRQGSGKTTMMVGAVEFIDPKYPLRILEMAPELYLREVYPERNILSLQETLTVTASEGQDALKKSDAAVSLVGEVATDEIASNMLQFAQLASKFTLFSHHANTAEDLVYAIRNSVANARKVSNLSTVEQLVVSILKVNIHLDYTPEGKRYIARGTEIIPLQEAKEYPTLDPNNLDYSRATVDREYYGRITDRKSFKTVQLFHYDINTDTYIFDNPFSVGLVKHMLSNMLEEYRPDFKKFLREVYNIGGARK